MISAFGKVILLGEHAVVYGHPALAGAIDRGLRAQVTPTDQTPGGSRSTPTATQGTDQAPLRLRVPAWSVDVAITDDHPVATAARAVAAHLDAPLRAPVTIEIAADLPAAAGLGSSAALGVALARALHLVRIWYAHSGGPGGHPANAEAALPDDATCAAANAAERCFHARPSGVDVALSCRGGWGLFRRGVGLSPVSAAPLALAVGLSGEPRRTADMVARVAAARDADPGVDARLASLGDAAERGRAALEAADGVPDALGPLMFSAHETLAGLGVSTAALDRLVDAAARAGARGAKLTGAGGGGAVIALAPDRMDAVLDAWRSAGATEVFACRAGVTP